MRSAGSIEQFWNTKNCLPHAFCNLVIPDLEAGSQASFFKVILGFMHRTHCLLVDLVCLRSPVVDFLVSINMGRIEGKDGSGRYDGHVVISVCKLQHRGSVKDSNAACIRIRQSNNQFCSCTKEKLLVKLN